MYRIIKKKLELSSEAIVTFVLGTKLAISDLHLQKFYSVK